MSGIPHELIRHAQISTRAAAGLPDYNPSDPNLPELPPLSALIASSDPSPPEVRSDPSPPEVRCKNCNGRLLRGSESIICVYCGSGPHYDAVPEPIRFTSTIGYQWLLRSLRLDGSEKVDRTTKNEQDLFQGQSSPKALTSLSDLLNFTIPWPTETEKEETSLSDKHSEESKRSLRLTGVAPDKFFINSNRNAISESSSEQPVSHNLIGAADRKDVEAVGNQNLFQNVQSSAPADSSSRQKTSDGFSGWQADFQFPDSENQHGGHKSSEHFAGSSAEPGNKFQDSQSLNRSTGSDFQFADFENQYGDQKSSEQFAGSSAEPGNKFQDSQSSDRSTGIDFQFADFENQRGSQKSSEKFAGSSDVPGNKLQDSESFDRSTGLDFQFADSENQHGDQKSSDLFAGSSAEPGNKFQDSDLFEDFQVADSENQHGGQKSSEQFAGSSSEPGNNFQDSDRSDGLEIDLAAHLDSVFGPGKDLNDGKPKDNSAVSPAFDAWNSDDLWNNLSSSKPNLAGGLDATVSTNDYAKADHNLNSSKPNFAGGLDATVSTKDDAKVDQTLENSKTDSSTGPDLFPDFQSQANFPAMPENKAMKNEEHKTEDWDSFAEWDKFTGSTSLQNPTKYVSTGSDYQVSTSNQKSSDLDLLSLDNKFEEGDLGSFSEPNLFSTSTSNSNAPPEANTTMSENIASNWLNDASNPSQEPGQAAKNEGASGKSTKEDDVKKLISEMHDLSFMLKTDLSVPSTSDPPTSPPKD